MKRLLLAGIFALAALPAHAQEVWTPFTSVWQRLDGGPVLSLGYMFIKDETTVLTSRPYLTFLGASVTCVDNAPAISTDCTFTGGGGGGVSDPGASGIMVRTSLNTSIARALACANTACTIANADGTAGNPTITVALNPTDSGGAVVLQATSPGTTQTGAFHLAGVTNILNFDAIGATPTDALLLQNSTASTNVVTVQESPALRLCGTAYNQTSTLSETDCYRIYNVPATVAGTTTSTLVIDRSINNGGGSSVMTLTSTGLMTLPLNGLTATLGDITVQAGNVLTGAANTFKFGATRSKLASPADGQILMENAANSDFGRLIFGLATSSFPALKKESASSISVRLGDDSAYGTSVALNYGGPAANTIASAATIAPTQNVTIVSGAVQISTITVPANFNGGCLHLIPSGTWSTATGGNISLATAAVTIGKTLIMCWDGTKWNPSY